jgi:hypothetical protein
MPMGTPTVPAVLVLVVMHFAAFAITLWAFTALGAAALTDH